MSPYIGRPIGVAGHTTQKLDDPSSISSNAFTMKVGNVAISPDAASLQIYVDGVRQEAGVAYTVSGSTLTFTGTFTSSNDFQGYVMGDAMYVEDNFINEAKLKVSNSPTNGQFLSAQSGNTGGLTWAAVSDPPVTALNNATANELVTVGSTTTELDAEANLTFDGSALAVTGTAAFTNSALSATSTQKCLDVQYTKTLGTTDASDNFTGISNEFTFNDADQFWGHIYGIYSKATVSGASSGESLSCLGIFIENEINDGDVENVFGAHIVTDINSGSTIDDKIYGTRTDVYADVTSGDGHLVHWSMADGSGWHATNHWFHRYYDGVNGDYVAQITALAGVATFDSGDFSGAPDYAEYFESKNGNIIAQGTTVKLDGDKVVACEEGDTPIGVARPDWSSSVVCGGAKLRWAGKYLKNDYDELIMEDYSVVQWKEEIEFSEYQGRHGDKARFYQKIDGKDGADDKYYYKHRYHTDRIPDGITVPDDAEIIDTPTQRKKLNPDFDESLEYVSRQDRPEWCLVGLLGQIPITKGQPTASNWIKMKDVSDTVEMWFVK